MAQNGFSSLGALFAGVGGGNPYLPGAREQVLNNMLLSQRFQLGNQKFASNQEKAQARQGFVAHFEAAHPDLSPEIAQYVGNAEAAGYNPEQIAQALASRQTRQMQLANWQAAQNPGTSNTMLNRMSIGAHPGSTYTPIRNEGGTILDTGANTPSLSGAMSAPVSQSQQTLDSARAAAAQALAQERNQKLNSYPANQDVTALNKWEGVYNKLYGQYSNHKGPTPTPHEFLAHNAPNLAKYVPISVQGTSGPWYKLGTGGTPPSLNWGTTPTTKSSGDTVNYNGHTLKVSTVVAQAKAAIANGRSKAAVYARLKSMGIDPNRLNSGG